MVMVCLMSAMFMVAIEATVVATAMPNIVAKLGGFTFYGWVFSAFLLAQSATTVMFGKLADLYGRKPVMIAGLIVFLIGSVLAGFSWSMPSLIAFRVIQGLGAGAIQPVSMTIIGDIYTLEERARVQGYMGSVWGVSAIVGPAAGALIVQYLPWAWIFWINLPLGVAAIIGLNQFLHEQVERHDRQVDYPGAALFTLAVTALLLAINPPPGHSVLSHPAMFGAVFVTCAGLFVWRERRAEDPMVAIDLWSEPVIATANGASLGGGIVLIGLTAFLPVFVQAVLGRSPVASAMPLTAMAFAWPVAANVSSRLLFRRIGMRTTLRVGSVLIVLGALTFPFLNVSPNAVLLAASGAFVMGFGMGMITMPSIMLIQTSVDWSRRGAATASNVFSRLLGNTLGAAVMGAILNLGLRLSGAGVTPEQVRGLMDHAPGAMAKVDPALKTALHGSLHWVFVVMAVLAVLTMISAFLMPHRAHLEMGPSAQPKPAE
jgi:MFS family permease